MHQYQRSQGSSVGRSFISEVSATEKEIKIAGWIHQLRIHSKTSFMMIKDCSGVIQCVMSSDLALDRHLRLDDCVEVFGVVRNEPRSKLGVELHVREVRKLNETTAQFPFNSTSELGNISHEVLLENRPLSLRNEKQGSIFKLQARAMEEVIELERELLRYMFEKLNSEFAATLKLHGQKPLPEFANVPVWEFEECLERLKKRHAIELTEDLNGEAERLLCAQAEEEFGVPAVFVVGFPLSARPFYTAPLGSKGAAASFDLLFRGLEITTGGQRLHRRSELEAAIVKRGLQPNAFESHLRNFDLGMPPHGGFAIGAERLTAQILGLTNVKEATLYPRDRSRVTP